MQILIVFFIKSLQNLHAFQKRMSLIVIDILQDTSELFCLPLLSNTSPITLRTHRLKQLQISWNGYCVLSHVIQSPICCWNWKEQQSSSFLEQAHDNQTTGILGFPLHNCYLMMASLGFPHVHSMEALQAHSCFLFSMKWC